MLRQQVKSDRSLPARFFFCLLHENERKATLTKEVLLLELFPFVKESRCPEKAQWNRQADQRSTKKPILCF